MAFTQEDLNLLKLNLQEKDSEVFSEEDLLELLERHQNVWLASFYGCMIKSAMKADITLPGGLSISGNSEYWSKLADTYKERYQKSLAEEDPSMNGVKLNAAGYKNSMQRADEPQLNNRGYWGNFTSRRGRF